MTKNNSTIQNRLFALQDTKYGHFQSKLIPNISPDTVIGVRIPKQRNLAKELIKESKNNPQTAADIQEFLNTLPHIYYDENVLHGLLLEQEKDYDSCISKIEDFLPYIDNWAVCDIIQPRILKKNRHKLISKTTEWILTGCCNKLSSKEIYTSRFGMRMLMSHYLDADFKPEYLELPARPVTGEYVSNDEYYLNMMVAWFYATALAKQWEATIPFIEDQVLPVWTHNKTIQKSIESRRISEDQKTYLRALKIK